MLAHPRDFVSITRENQEALLGFVCDSAEEALRVISFGQDANIPVVLHVADGDVNDLLIPAGTSTAPVVLHSAAPKDRGAAHKKIMQGVRSFTVAPDSDFQVLQGLRDRGAWLEGAGGTEHEHLQHGIYVLLDAMPGAFTGRGYISFDRLPPKTTKYHAVAYSDVDLAPEHLEYVASGSFSKIILPAKSMTSGLVDKLVEVSFNDTVHYTNNL